MPPAPEAKALLKRLGYYDADSLNNRIKVGYDDDFLALTGDLDAYIDMYLFIDSCEQMFDMSEKLARAIFHAMDLKVLTVLHGYLICLILLMQGCW